MIRSATTGRTVPWTHSSFRFGTGQASTVVSSFRRTATGTSKTWSAIRCGMGTLRDKLRYLSVTIINQMSDEKNAFAKETHQVRLHCNVRYNAGNVPDSSLKSKKACICCINAAAGHPSSRPWIVLAWHITATPFIPCHTAFLRSQATGFTGTRWNRLCGIADHDRTRSATPPLPSSLVKTSGSLTATAGHTGVATAERIHAVQETQRRPSGYIESSHQARQTDPAAAPSFPADSRRRSLTHSVTGGT